MADQHPGDPGTARSIDLTVEVAGTPEVVWRAVATGPGISSWYVPHEVAEHQGGRALARFGPGPEMEVPGRVAVWDPPRRVVFDGGEGVGGLAFEWLVEPRRADTCAVRLVNSGFGSGGEWDEQYDAMVEGWRRFMANLALHLEHFPGREATACLPTASWAGPRDEAWRRLLGELGLPDAPAVGDRVEADGPDVPGLAGPVAGVGEHHLLLLLDHPAPGTGFVTAEGHGATGVSVSVFTYLYGEEGAAAARRDEPRWREWLAARATGDR